MSNHKRKDKYLIISSLILMLCLSIMVYYFNVFWETEYNMPFGKSDVKNYLSFMENPKPYLKDPSHFTIVRLFNLFGIKEFISFTFWIIMFYVFFLYYQYYFTVRKALLSAFLLFFGTSYLSHAFYVGVLAQTLSFMFWILLLLGRARKNKLLEVSSVILMVLSHGLSAIVVSFYYMLEALRKNDLRSLKISFLLITVFLTLFCIYADPKQGYLELGTSLMNKSKSVFMGVNNLEPPYFFVLLTLLNPIMIGVCINSLNPFYLGFFLASIFAHNGRMTLYFLPLLVLETMRRVKTPQSYFMIILTSILYAIYINTLFMAEVFDYIDL